MTHAIVLAAGRSRRMGKPKLLLPYAGSTVIARVVDAYLETPVEQVIVVVSPQADALRAALGDRPVVFVENPDGEGDMLSSLRCGLRALPAEAKILLASPADQPALEAELIRRMLAAFRAGLGSLLVPVCGDRRGHPLVFSARFRDELLTSYEGLGLRGLLQSHPAEVIEWPTADASVLEDLDTPGDYDAATARDHRRGSTDHHRGR